MSLVNFDQEQDATVSLSILSPGNSTIPRTRYEYLLTPDWPGGLKATARDRSTSRSILLNKELLRVGPIGQLPQMKGVERDASLELHVPALSILFVVYEDVAPQLCT